MQKEEDIQSANAKFPGKLFRSIRTSGKEIVINNYGDFLLKADRSCKGLQFTA